MTKKHGTDLHIATRQRCPRNDKRNYYPQPSSSDVAQNHRSLTDRIVAGLEASTRISFKTGHPGADIRPCIATLVESSLDKGDFPNRNVGALIIACEFRRLGFKYDDTFHRVECWNRENNPPLRPKELLKAVDNAFAREYNYGCSNAVFVRFCLGQDVCPFRNTVLGKKAKYNELAFVDYGWPKLLTSRQVLIYAVALPYLERTRRVGRGGLICANHMQIAETCGIRRERLGKDLRVLAEVGLIDYEVGRRYKWEGIASRIRRIFPIPYPKTRSSLRVRGCDKTHRRKIEFCHNINKVSNNIIDTRETILDSDSKRNTEISTE